MVGRRFWFPLAVLAAILITPGSVEAAIGRKIKLTRERVLKGEWRGEAKVEKGKSVGKTWKWQLKFGKGDLTRVGGVCINEVKEVKSKNFSLKRPFKMQIIYLVGGTASFDIMMEVEFDETFTRMTGKFKNIMGAGTFELVKRNCDPPAERLKGEWSGTVKGTKGVLARKTAEMTLKPPRGKLKEAEVSLTDLEVRRVVPSCWDDETRETVFFLVCREKKEKKDTLVQVAGTFSPDFKSFSAVYKGKKIGEGTIELKNNPSS